MKLFALKPHPDAAVKNTLTQPHSCRVISMASTNRWGLLTSRLPFELLGRAGCWMCLPPCWTPLWSTNHSASFHPLPLSSGVPTWYSTNQQPLNLLPFCCLHTFKTTQLSEKCLGYTRSPYKAMEFSFFSSGFWLKLTEVLSFLYGIKINFLDPCGRVPFSLQLKHFFPRMGSLFLFRVDFVSCGSGNHFSRSPRNRILICKLSPIWWMLSISLVSLTGSRADPKAVHRVHLRTPAQMQHRMHSLQGHLGVQC